MNNVAVVDPGSVSLPLGVKLAERTIKPMLADGSSIRAERCQHGDRV